MHYISAAGYVFPQILKLFRLTAIKMIVMAYRHVNAFTIENIVLVQLILHPLFMHATAHLLLL